MDVREVSQFAEGHLVGAHNLPCDMWRESVEFAQETALKYIDKDEIIVHCFKSQMRGPCCAQLLAKEYKYYIYKNPGVSMPSV